MNILLSPIEPQNAFNLNELKENQEELQVRLVNKLKKAPASQAMTVANISARAQMAHNFVDNSAESSKYVKATLSDLHQQTAMDSKQNAALNSVLSATSTAESMTDRILAGKRAASSIMQGMDKTVLEEGLKVHETIQNEIESRDEASDEDSIPISQQNNSAEPTVAPATTEGSSSPSSIHPIDIIA